MTNGSNNMVGNFSNNSGVFNQGADSEIVQGGKGNTTNEYADFEKIVAELIEEIRASKGVSPEDKEDAINDTINIEKAVKEGKLDRAKKLFTVLSNTVRTLGSAASLAAYLGI
ncbi:hypothetical protein [Paenibacillus sp. FSL R5-808]|uniref:hypothetical protein n=1 Tax=Paenibacillus sp. FSL R5-808 TaxID=1227076 RepID=UPI0003E2465D|nr:hypothetical protein [Paenibacillus sp. FSL R5-808]ETT33286.1 hypothetical protein C169_22860 [Paenibacillus sp. FSL R5-808]